MVMAISPKGLIYLMHAVMAICQGVHAQFIQQSAILFDHGIARSQQLFAVENRVCACEEA
jgi:hypothetical protein